MNRLSRKIAIAAAALALCATAVPLAVHAQQPALELHTMSMTFDMPNMTPQQFRVTSQIDFQDLKATATSDPQDVAVCSVHPESAAGEDAGIKDEKVAVFTVVPKAPGTCTIHLSDPKLGSAQMVATVNLHGIYVIDGNAIKVFEPTTGNVNPVPIATIAGPKTHLNDPRALAIDGAGNIYVANEGNSSITMYAANRTGDRAPDAMIIGKNTGLQAPWGIALDAAGNLYVTNPQGGPGETGSIAVFAAHPKGVRNDAPLMMIGGDHTMLHAPYGIALDGNGRIYAVNHSGSVTVYPALAVKEPAGYVDQVPLATIAGDKTMLNAPTSIALDSLGKVYVANSGIGSTQTGHITVYAANPAGDVNEAPLSTIQGSNTNLGFPQGIAIDASGAIIVANPSVASLTPSVTRYTMNGEANIAPLMMFVGSNLESPSGVAIH